MNSYLYSISVSRSYNIRVEAESETEAFKQVSEMQTTDITRLGNVTDISVDDILLIDVWEDEE